MTFISAMGEDVYNCKIIELLNKLLDPSILNDQPTHYASNSVEVESYMMNN